MNPLLPAVRRRRAILSALALAPLLAFSATEGPRKKRLVVLTFNKDEYRSGGYEEIVRMLGERGFAQGKQLEVIRFAVDEPPSPETNRVLIERHVVPLKPDVILTGGSILTYQAFLATRTIPIVTSVPDPVDSGFAQSLARPGGNVTGLARGAAESSTKSVEMLRLLIPRLTRLAIFHGTRPVPVRHAGHFERAARSAGLEPVMVTSDDPAVLVEALRALPSKRIQAAYWAFAPGEPAEVAREALRARMPLASEQEEWTEAGLLASYSWFDPAPLPRLARIVEQILRGADPAGIPFDYTQQFRFVINRRTALALGIPLTPELMLRADRVID